MLVMALAGLLVAFLLPLGLTTFLVKVLFRKWGENAYVAFSGSIVSNWTTLVILLLIFFPRIDLGLGSIGFREAISLTEIGLALLFAFASIGWFALNARLKIFEMKRMSFRIRNWGHIVILLLAAPITAAFCEEFFYRGFAITVLGSELGNPWIAGLISSIVFAFMHIPHYGLGGSVSIGISGLLMMILYMFTGSIYPGILAHSLNNLFGFVLVPLFLKKKRARVE